MENLYENSMLPAKSFKILYIAGKFIHDFVCCINLPSAISIQGVWIFHVFWNVCPYAMDATFEFSLEGQLG